MISILILAASMVASAIVMVGVFFFVGLLYGFMIRPLPTDIRIEKLYNWTNFLSSKKYSMLYYSLTALLGSNIFNLVRGVF